MRFIFACGGTGGHINPALAVARLVKEKRKNAEILFVGIRGGMEERLVANAGFEIKTIESSFISRKKGIHSILNNIYAAKRVLCAERAAEKIINEFKPDVVMGTGGYACYPVLSAAARMNIPTLVHEANAYPGLATRALAKRVSCVLLNFSVSRERLPKTANCIVVGNPVRGDILMYDRETARRELDITRPLLVSFWGSLGAREMNKAIAEVMRLETEHPGEFQHIHACGKFGYEWMPSLLLEKGIDINNNSFVTLREYIDDMPRHLAAADLVMCRGGAGTLSEISARGTPAIIVPSPNVTDNHQFKNASELQRIGGAVVVEEKDASPDYLYNTAKKLLFDAKKRAEMSENLIAHSVLDASEHIYAEMMSITKR